MTLTKICPACKIEKPLAEFSRQVGYRGGFRHQCKACRSAYQRAYNKTDRAKVLVKVRGPQAQKRRSQKRRAHGGRELDLKSKYGMTQVQFEAVLTEQGGCCAICRTSNPRGRYNRFHVDHCHETGGIRGLLCHKCNMALGIFGDTLQGVMRVVAYLERPSLHMLNANQLTALNRKTGRRLLTDSRKSLLTALVPTMQGD